MYLYILEKLGEFFKDIKNAIYDFVEKSNLVSNGIMDHNIVSRECYRFFFSEVVLSFLVIIKYNKSEFGSVNEFVNATYYKNTPNDVREFLKDVDVDFARRDLMESIIDFSLNIVHSIEKLIE